MPVDTRDFVHLVCTLAEDNNLQVTVKESLKGGLCAGGGAFFGGVVGGPVGIAVGATVGGCVGAYMTRNKFQSAVTVIRKMDYEKKQKLVMLVREIVSKFEIKDAAMLLTVVMGDPNIQKQILGTVVSFLQNEMRMEIRD